MATWLINSRRLGQLQVGISRFDCCFGVTWERWAFVLEQPPPVRRVVLSALWGYPVSAVRSVPSLDVMALPVDDDLLGLSSIIHQHRAGRTRVEWQLISASPHNDALPGHQPVPQGCLEGDAMVNVITPADALLEEEFGPSDAAVASKRIASSSFCDARRRAMDEDPKKRRRSSLASTASPGSHDVLKWTRTEAVARDDPAIRAVCVDFEVEPPGQPPQTKKALEFMGQKALGRALNGWSEASSV